MYLYVSVRILVFVCVIVRIHVFVCVIVRIHVFVCVSTNTCICMCHSTNTCIWDICIPFRIAQTACVFIHILRFTQVSSVLLDMRN